jgi:AbiU2
MESPLSLTPTLKQILDALKKQVLVGRTYLNTSQGLLNADPVLLQTAPTFFGMAIDGNLELAQMAVARLYDATRNTMSVPKMLKRADQEAGTFKRADAPEVRKAVAECEKIVEGLAPVIESINERRNGWLAHLDPSTIADPAGLSTRANLTFPDLQKGFKDTEEIILKISSLYEGVIGGLRYIGDDDYHVALDWIRRARCTFIERYEQEFKEKWTGPRPKDCSRRDWDLL